jgi:hypothetical protein
MSKADRGVYQPPSENFDLYDAVEDDEEERSRLPLLIIVALLVLAAFTGVVWLAYNQGVQSGRSGAPVIVSAPAGPVKTAGDANSGQTPYAGLKVYDKPVPPDEEAESSTLAAPPPPVPDNPAPVAQSPQPPPPPEVRLGEGAPEKPAAAVATQAPPALPPAAKAAPPASTAVSSPVKAAPVTAPAKAPPVVAAATPPKATQAPAPLQQHSAAATLASQSPAQIPAALAAAAPSQTKPGAGGGRAMLQIGAYESEDLAKSAWMAFQSKHAGSLAGATSDIQRADLGSKGIWYRLRVGPFADKSAANTVCDKLKAEGAGCFAAAP